MSFLPKADRNIGIVNQYILNQTGGIENFGSVVLGFHDPVFGLPTFPGDSDKYISLSTANTWKENHIVVYYQEKEVWKNIQPISGALVWVANLNAPRMWNAADSVWELPAITLGGVVAPSPVFDNSVPTFNGTSGYKIQSTPVTIDSLGNMDNIQNIRVSGDVLVNGTLTSLDSNQVVIKDSYLSIGSGYSLAAPRESGILLNYAGTGVTVQTVSPGFTEAIPAFADANITVDSPGPDFFDSDLIQVSGSENNNGLYEVLSHSAGTITLKSVGLNPTTEDFVATQLTTEDIAGAVISGVNILSVRASETGLLEYANGSASGFSYATFADTDTTVRKQTFTGDSVFILPPEIRHVWLTIIAAGGGGGAANASNSAGGGGGSGAIISRYYQGVSGSELINITIGVGGAGGLSGNAGQQGGNSSVEIAGKTLTAYGGGGGGGASFLDSAGGGGGGGGTISPGLTGTSDFVASNSGSGGAGGNSSVSFPIQGPDGGDGGDCGDAGFVEPGVQGSVSLHIITGGGGGGGSFSIVQGGIGAMSGSGFSGGAVGQAGSGAGGYSGVGGAAGSDSNGQDCTAIGGGGGGAASDLGTAFFGGSGGSGSVIIEYA